MAGEDSKPAGTCSQLVGTHFMIGKKIPMKILEFKRYGIGIIAEFCGISSGFPNQATQAPADDFWELKMNVATFMSLLWVLLGSDCDYYIRASARSTRHSN